MVNMAFDVLLSTAFVKSNGILCFSQHKNYKNILSGHLQTSALEPRYWNLNCNWNWNKYCERHYFQFH